MNYRLSTVLIGRETECATLDALLDRARQGQSGALVLRGEAGIGKSTLLEYAVERARGMTVVRALGVESEAELEFGGLLDVCRPLLDVMNELPPRLAEALRGALGLDAPEALDRFSVAVATLALIAAAAERDPLLIAVDDAQWLDVSSQEALLFATRRLRVDPVAVLYAARDGEERPFDAPGVEALTLTGLQRDEAAALLGTTDGPGVAPAVAASIHAATGGNPLALLELPRALSAEQRGGTVPLEDPLPVTASIEHAFAGRAKALPAASRRALLVAALSTSSDGERLGAALSVMGLDTSALELAEDAGLLNVVDGKPQFRHPLVRSAVVHAAAPSERRAAHRALGDALAGGDPEARAWHLAGAALGPDEEVASALEQAAELARARSGYAAAAAGLERAARLTPDAALALDRLAAAADAAWRAGRPDVAARLVGEALARAPGDGVRGRLLRLRGEVEYFGGEGQSSADSYLEAVALLERTDPEEAIRTAADAISALVRARQFGRAVETAHRARAAAPLDGSPLDLEATVALGFALCFAGRYADAEPELRRAVDLFGAQPRSPGLLQVGKLSAALAWLGRFGDAHAAMAQAVARARADGAVGALPHLLATSSWEALHAGRWNEAMADAGEARELAEELGQPVIAAQALGVQTWLHAYRGDEARCRAHAEEIRARASELRFTLYRLLADAAVGVLQLGIGRVDEAIAFLAEPAAYAQERGLYIAGVAPQLELAEAFTRAGRPAEADEILSRLERSELAAAPPLAALAERCRGLLVDDAEIDGRFAAALGLHESVDSAFQAARTRLCYGERLRRARRRVEAREQVRTALAVFEALSARAWAERARKELRASGETLRRRDPAEPEELTPQELQIALQVAEGKTNKEVGAALFLSHKTVEFHLSRIFRKLDLHSRAELVKHVTTGTILALEPG